MQYVLHSLLDSFHIWLEIHVPRWAVRGQYRLLRCLYDFSAAWQSEIDTDWPASLHLSVFVSLHVIHLSLLKSMHSPRTLEDTEDLGQYCSWFEELNRNWFWDDATVAIVTGRSNLQSLRVLIECLLSKVDGQPQRLEVGKKRDE